MKTANTDYAGINQFSLLQKFHLVKNENRQAAAVLVQEDKWSLSITHLLRYKYL